MRKATLASILRKSRPGVRLNEHLEHPEGDRRIPTRLQDGAGRHCLEAAGIALSVGTLAGLAQVQEPRGARRETRGRGGLGSLMSFIGTNSLSVA